MKRHTVWAQRASGILFNVIRSLERPGVFVIPSNVCPVVAATFLKAGVGFELVDIDPETLCLDQALLMRKLEEDPARYGGVLFVHTYGVPASFESAFRGVKELAPHALLIDDRCLCVPSFDDQEPTAADVILYSTGYSKYVEMGYGGYAFIKPEIRCGVQRLEFTPAHHEALVEAMRTAQEAGSPFRYRDSNWLDGGSPAGSFASYQLEVQARAEKVRPHKELLNRIYRENIPHELQIGAGYHDWRFNILVPRKEKLLQSIFEQGLFASSHYPSLGGVFAPGARRHAEDLHSRVVNLFNNERFSAEQAERVSALVREHLKGCDRSSC